MNGTMVAAIAVGAFVAGAVVAARPSRSRRPVWVFNPQAGGVDERTTLGWSPVAGQIDLLDPERRPSPPPN